MANKKSSTTSKTKTTKKPAAKKPVAKKSVSSVAKKPATRPKTVHATEPYHPVFGVIILIVCAIVLSLLLPFTVKMIVSSLASDGMRFSDEYSLVEVDNVYKYKTAEETTDILEHGTGVVFLGFPSCPWCQTYAKFLIDVAKETGVEEIAYYNIHDDRESDTDVYKKFVSILGDSLQYDNNGKHRIYVPEVVFVVDGEIIGNDHETSKDTLGLEDPEAYWTDERVEALKTKLAELFKKIAEKKGCATSCND